MVKIVQEKLFLLKRITMIFPCTQNNKDYKKRKLLYFQKTCSINLVIKRKYEFHIR